jgi:hypothetical protein
MGLITPTLGGDSGSWDDKINACFALVDAHDHTSGKGTLVPVAGLDIDADLAMAGFAVTGIASLGFNAVAALVSGSKRLFVSSADNELYWRTNAGTNVKLTDGTSINTTLVGGIVGDYSSVGAEVAYDDANDRYTFKQQGSPKTWARMSSGDVRLFETGTSESVYVGMAAPSGLAASYDLIWPAALPIDAEYASFQVNSTGQVRFSNVISAYSAILPAASFQQTGSSHVFNGTYWALGNSSTDTLYAPIPLAVGDVLTSVKVYLDKNSDASNTVTVEVWRSDPAPSGSVATSLGSAADSGNATGVTAGGIGPAGLSVTATSGHAYMVAVSQSDATPSSSDFIFTIEYVFDKA